MKPDPRFPNRPTHSDFDLLSKLAIEQDEHADDIHAFTGSEVDPECLRYVAQNRAEGAIEAFTQRSDQPLNEKAIVMAGIVDGFMLGVRFAKARLIQNEEKWIAPNGTNRKD